MRSVATLTTMTSPTPSSKVGEDDAVLKGAFLGPDSLKGLFRWHKNMAATLFAKGGLPSASVVDRPGTILAHCISHLHVILTSEFSGMGTAELALQMALAGISKELQKQSRGWFLFKERLVLRSCAYMF